ncbi:MAG: hypothetical protein ACPL7K_01830, partial [Armatimonadota bacterium]
KTQGASPVTVRTWTTTDPANLTRGNHENVWFWDAYDDGGSPAPPGTYDVVVTATAAPISGTDLVPLWEDTYHGISTHWLVAAVNTNPASPYFGYVYAVNWFGERKGVWMWDPAGNFVKGGLFGISWGTSAPWGVDVGDDGYVYVSDYSLRKVYRFSPDLESHSASTVSTTTYPRFMAVEGPESNLRLAATQFTASAPTSTYATLMTSSGSSWPIPTCTRYDYPAEGMDTQPDITPSGIIYVSTLNNQGGYSGGKLFAF